MLATTLLAAALAAGFSAWHLTAGTGRRIAHRPGRHLPHR